MGAAAQPPAASQTLQPAGYSRQENIIVFTAQRTQYGFQHRNSAIKSKLRHWKCIPTGQSAIMGGCDWTENVNLVLKVFRRDVCIFHPSMEVIVGVLLAVGVIYHAVDMDLFAHVHGEDEREPAGAEVGAGLDPANTQRNH